MHPSEYSARQIRDALNNPIFGTSTGALSLLHDTLSKWALIHPELRAEVDAFGQARHGWWPGDPRRDTPSAWTRVVTTGLCVADRMATYQDERLVLCGRPSVYDSSCQAVMLPVGVCSYGPSAHPEEV